VSLDEVLRMADRQGAEAAGWLRDLIRAIDVPFEERTRSGWQALTFHHPDAGYVVGIFPRTGCAELIVEHGADLDAFADVFDGDGGSQIRKVIVCTVPDPRSERIVDVILAAIASRLTP
jgi:hypothetical protein